MDLFCDVCDRSIIQNPSKYDNCVATRRKNYDKSLCEKNTIIINNLDKVDEIFDDFVSTHNKKFYYYLVGCDFY